MLQLEIIYTLVSRVLVFIYMITLSLVFRDWCVSAVIINIFHNGLRRNDF